MAIQNTQLKAKQKLRVSFQERFDQLPKENIDANRLLEIVSLLNKVDRDIYEIELSETLRFIYQNTYLIPEKKTY